MPETTDVQRLIVSLEANVKKYEKALAKASGTADRRARQIETRFARMNRNLDAGFSRLGRGLLVGAIGAVGIRQIQQYADTWTRVQNQLRVVGLEGARLDGTLNELFEIAQRNGTAIEPLTTLYGRLAQSQAELGASADELTRFTEGVSVALRVQGGDAQSANGALLQLSQAMGSAVVRAEEFNSINEGARPILQAVANGLEEAGGSVAKLRALVIDGKVSSEAFFRAFLAGMGGLEQQAARTQGTVGQATNRMENSFTRLIGEIDKAGKVSSNLASVMGSVASALDAAADGAGAFVDKLQEINSYLKFIENLGPAGLIKAILGNDPLAALGPVATSIRDIADSAEAISGGGPSRRLGPRRHTVDPVSVTDFAVEGDGKKTKDKIDDYERETAAIMARTDALRLEAEVFGLNTLEAEKMRAEHELLNAAEQAGIPITDAVRAEVEGLSQAYAEAAVQIEDMEERQATLNETASAFGDFFGQAFNVIAQGGEDATAAIIKLAAQLVASIVQAKILNSTLGGTPTGNLLTSLLGAVVGGLATGGPAKANTPYIVGEKGPELFVPGASGTVVPNHALQSVPRPAAVNGQRSESIELVIAARPGDMFQPYVEQISGQQTVRIVSKSLQRFGRDAVPGIARQSVQKDLRQGNIR